MIMIWPIDTLMQLGIHPTASEPTPQEAWESLAARITYLFSEKVGILIGPSSDLCKKSCLLSTMEDRNAYIHWLQ